MGRKRCVNVCRCVNNLFTSSGNLHTSQQQNEPFKAERNFLDYSRLKKVNSNIMILEDEFSEHLSTMEYILKLGANL